MGPAPDISADIALAIPRYDPLDRRRNARPWLLLLLSALIHGVLLLLFWEFLMGTVIEEEETVSVKMFEEKPKLERKVVAQRRLDTSVSRFKEIAQPKISKVKPITVMDQVKQVKVTPRKLTEAPRKIETRKVVTRTVNEFAEVVQPVQPVQVDQVTAEVRQVQAAKESSGPKKLDAAGPITSPRAANVEAPTLNRGEISRNVVDGAPTGAKIAALESGNSDGLLRGDGGGGGGTEVKDCSSDPVCMRYLLMIRDRVLARWHSSNEIPSGRVTLRFRIDRGGSAHNVKIVSADNTPLGESCKLAFRHASPFPPPPKEIHYLVTKGIRATFTQEGN
jgi:TonB family protein